jgi:hypothetical protein
MASVPSIMNFRRQSLLRGNLLVLASFLLAIYLSDFPHNRATLWLVLPLLTAILGLAETVRCMQRRWNFYHGGVVLCVYMDLMALAMITFFLLYPYALWLSSSK